MAEEEGSSIIVLARGVPGGACRPNRFGSEGEKRAIVARRIRVAHAKHFALIEEENLAGLGDGASR
jgi:hypothetical protein